MRTVSETNKFTVEDLIAKYRTFVKDNSPLERVLSEWQDDDGQWHSEDCYVIMDPYDAAEKQLLISLYKEIAGDRADVKVIESLSKMLEVFKREAFTENEYRFLCEHFSEVSAYLFDHWNEWLGGQSSASTSFPKIKEYVLKKSMFREGQTVFIADSSSCDIAAIFLGCKVQGFTGFCGSSSLYDEAWAIGQIRLFAAGIESEIVPGVLCESGHYSYSLPSKASVDLVIYGTMRDTECTDVEALYDLLKDEGRMLVFISRFHYYSISDNNAFFRKLVESRAISSLVSFENEDPVFGGSETYLLLCIEKKRHLTTYIESAIKNISTEVEATMLDSAMLLPGYYLASRPNDGCPLSSLVSLFSGKDEDLKQNKSRKKKDVPFDEDSDSGLSGDLLVLAPKDFGERYCDANLSIKELSPLSDPMFDSYRSKMHELDKPGVCLRGNTESMIVGYISDNPTKYCCLASVPYLIPKRDIDVRYIAALLLYPEVKQQVISICDGSVSTLTLSKVLDRIIVPKHDPEERLRFLAEANYEAFLSTQQEMKKNHEDYKKAVRMRKHALTQSLSSIEAMFYALDAYRVRQDGKLTDEDVISRRKGTTVKDAFEFIEPNLKNMMVTLEHIADVEYSFNRPEWIEPEQFIEDYVTQNESGWLNFKPVINWEKGQNRAKSDLMHPDIGDYLEGKELSCYQLYFPKQALKRILDNVVANAIAHGFTDSNRLDYQLRFSWYIDDINLVIEIENNGTPIPAGRDTASLLEYGVSGALHHDGHNGIGCNEIYDIMRRYEGEVEIVSTPDKEYTVKYILTFKANMVII